MSARPMFERVLIANRGEIAIRIARAAAGLGIDSVAVYAAPDAASLHTRVAGSAHELKAPDPVRAYLNIDALLDVAAATGCDCVHPGYGFLSEDAEFAERCAAAGLTFIGPPPAALALFGAKVQARRLAASLGIPTVPGSADALESAAQARSVAAEVGYPVMLKASAGGGGRGMRQVESADQLDQAFDRCRSEAEAAFGDGALFLERVIERPRHVEVQVLADGEGRVVHLHERDCSVQQRHQKVIEVAPAPALAEGLRRRLHDDAVRLVAAAGYRNAGTVEFLVCPERDEYFFIECNPRIQVEHTVTEAVTGIDLVESQFRIAAGASLADLGLADQAAVGAPRGFAVQARVVARGGGTLRGYKEPAGFGVRVDACGYAGYRPALQFDPLLAKVIGTATAPPAADALDTYRAALDRARRALDEFHISGVPTNLAELRSILDHDAVRAGDARVSLLSEDPDCLRGAGPVNGATLALLEQGTGGAGPGVLDDHIDEAPALPVEDGQIGVECPISGQVIAWSVEAGDAVAAGDTLLVISAMKMETVIAAPESGTVAARLEASPGSTLGAGWLVVVMAPDRKGGEASGRTGPERGPWQDVLDEVDTLRAMARERLAPGSEDPGVVRQRSRGKLTCRERIDALLDPGSFREVGSVAGFASYQEDGRVANFTPANHVGGWGTIQGRRAVVCADDFTSRGGHSDGAIGAKSLYLDRLALELQVPCVRLLDGSSGGGSVASMVPEQKQQAAGSAEESSGHITAGRPRVAGTGGSFLPGHLGSSHYAEQLATTPVVNLLLGSVVGIGAAKAVLGHFSVMVRDIAQLFVAGPPVVRHAMGYEVSKEDLGDWRIHCRNGSVDNLAESETDAIDQARRFLSYLPDSVYRLPPVLPPDPRDAPDRRVEALQDVIPRKRTMTFDVRRVVALMADEGSFFEIGRHWGSDQVTGFVRFHGHVLGVIASDSRHVNGGALTADGCRKLTRHLDLCDLFHVPVLNLVDNPGFAVGIEHERAGTIRAGGEWMIAFAQVNVPIFTVIMRRSFGVAGNNYATPRSRPSVRVVWPAADVGGIPPEGGIEAAYARQLREAPDPDAFRAELMARIESARGPSGPLSRFQMEEMIDPRDTRRLVCEWVELAYQLMERPDRLGPRPLQFRP